MMSRKANTADGYPLELAVSARRMCLYVATILGDLLDEIVVVGGLVPYLVIDQARVAEAHVGTRDLDLGLSIAVLHEERYRDIASRLRDRGFERATNNQGKLTRQTWKLDDGGITIDFLIPPARGSERPGSLQNLEHDFAAIVIPALSVAFQDTDRVVIDDETPTGERARREVNVAGPAAFVVMKAHALRLRGENKDAYDLVYLLMNYGGAPVIEVAKRYGAISEMPEAVLALEYLKEAFETDEHTGPRRYAEFLGDSNDFERRTEALVAVREFLRLVER